MGARFGRLQWPSLVERVRSTALARVLSHPGMSSTNFGRLSSARGVTSTGSTGQTVADPSSAATSSHRGLLGRLLTELDLPYEEEEARTPPKSAPPVRRRAAGKRRQVEAAGDDPSAVILPLRLLVYEGERVEGLDALRRPLESGHVAVAVFPARLQTLLTVDLRISPPSAKMPAVGVRNSRRVRGAVASRP